MSVSYWLDRSNESKRKNFDVVIIGAGITGVSTAYWLNQEDPSLKLQLLKKIDWVLEPRAEMQVLLPAVQSSILTV